MQEPGTTEQVMVSSGTPQPSTAPAFQTLRPVQRAVVAVVATRPETVLEDVQRAMVMAGVTQHLEPELTTLLKINISWQHWYPGCSTTPWQLDGVIQALKNLGHKNLIGAHNGTVVVDSYEGELNNKHRSVQERHGLPTLHLDTAPNRWVEYRPRPRCWCLMTFSPRVFRFRSPSPGPILCTCPR